jgi:hypothetical protein
MNRKKQKGRFISLKANVNELKMLSFIMDKDCRNSISDCLRALIKERFFFLTSNINISVIEQNIDMPTTAGCPVIPENRDFIETH